MVLNLDQQNWFYFGYNHQINDSRGILKKEVIKVVAILSLVSHKHIVQATRAKPEHTSCLDQATLGCFDGKVHPATPTVGVHSAALIVSVHPAAPMVRVHPLP
jgi:hypothetical protein